MNDRGKGPTPLPLPEDPSFRRTLTVGLAAALLGLLSLLVGASRTRWGHANLVNDDGAYWAGALSLIEGKGYLLAWAPWDTAMDRFPPGWPLVLAAVMKGLGDGFGAISAAQVFNLVLWAGTLAYVYVWCVKDRGWNGWVSWLGLALLALHPLTSETTSALLSEPLFSFLLAVAVRMWGRPKQGMDLFFFGLVLGFAMITRYALMPILLAATSHVWFSARRRIWPYFIGLALPLGLWSSWWLAMRPTGYVGQVQHWFGSDPNLMIFAFMWSLARTFIQAIPSVALPGIFLINYPATTNPAAGGFPTLVLALVVDALLVACLWRVTKDNGLPKTLLWGLLGYLGMGVIWQSGFPELKEHLPFRLLLPILPFCVSFAFNGGYRVCTLINPNYRRLIALPLTILALSVADLCLMVVRMASHVASLRQLDILEKELLSSDLSRLNHGQLVSSDSPGKLFWATGARSLVIRDDPTDLMETIFVYGATLFFMPLYGLNPEGTPCSWRGLEQIEKQFPGLIKRVEDREVKFPAWFAVDPRVLCEARKHYLRMRAHGRQPL